MKSIPTIIGERFKRNQIKIWCKYCNKHHVHGFPEGHRAAHCGNSDSSYNKTILHQDEKPYLVRI